MYTTYSGQRTTLQDFLGLHLNGSQVLYIGTDSRNTDQTKFSTVLVSHHPDRGGVLLKRVFSERKIHSLAERLLREAWYSVELALEVAPMLPANVKIEIHLDVNQSPVHKSGRYLQPVVGLVMAQGFDYRVKPDAWCATCIADKVVKAI
jgi:uncharacterized protein